MAAGVFGILDGALGVPLEVLRQGRQPVPVGLGNRAVLEDDAGGDQTRQGEQCVSQFHEYQGFHSGGRRAVGLCEMTLILSGGRLSAPSPPG
ncbi:hypothetical protein D3C85_1643280 [compost metagenome]